MTPEEKAKKEAIEAMKAAAIEANKETADKVKALETAREEAEKTIEAVKGEVISLQAKLKAAEEKATTNEGKKNAYVEFVKKHKKEIKEIAKRQSSAELVVKALSNRASIASDVQGYLLPDIGELAYRKLSMYDIFPKFGIDESNNSGVIRYRDWDQSTIVRAAAAVAEGGTFPESTAKFTMKSINLEKIGDTLPVTEEFMEDDALFAAELNFFIDINVQLEMDRQLANGSGTGNEIYGILTTVTNSYDGSADAGTVENASTYDLIVKMAQKITATGGAKYTPDIALMNIADINNMRLTKDRNFNYVLPPFVAKDGTEVSGIFVVEANSIPAGTLVVGDRRFARIYEKGGIQITQGLVNAQFTADEITIRARKRMAFLIRYADLSGFQKCTDIATALTNLTKV